jgi:hypothetical protein
MNTTDDDACRFGRFVDCAQENSPMFSAEKREDGTIVIKTEAELHLDPETLRGLSLQAAAAAIVEMWSERIKQDFQLDGAAEMEKALKPVF